MVIARRSKSAASCFWLVVMITKEQVMPLLLGSCPSFSDKWEEHRAFHKDEYLLYVDLGEFARHLVELQRTHRIEEFLPFSP
jgi:hypothetical protein